MYMDGEQEGERWQTPTARYEAKQEARIATKAARKAARAEGEPN